MPGLPQALIPLQRLTRDIRFWLVVFFLVRLAGITHPPLEHAHDWRQCLTNMMSRNLYETDSNPLYPRVDNGGKHDGIIASEFPVYNYVVYLISVLFGYDHWYGRLVNLVFSTIASWYFYKLIRWFFPERLAFYSTLLLTLSIWFSFSRKTMPDVFSMSLMIMAVYQVFGFVLKPQWWRLAMYGILASLAVLAKLPALYALGIVGIILLKRNTGIYLKSSVLMVTTGVFAIGYWWYFVWGDYLLKTWEYQLFFPKNYKEGPPEFLAYLDLALERFYFSAFQSFLAFALFLTGIILALKNRQHSLFAVFLFTFPVFLIFIIKTGNVFALHSYYIIPFVPVMALIAGYGLYALSAIRPSWILLLIGVEAIANQQHDFFIPPAERFKLGLEATVNLYVPKGEKVAMAGITGPQYLYFAHRKGWGVSTVQTLDTGYMKFVQSKNYRYLVLIKREFAPLPLLPYRKIGDEQHLQVFDMHHKP